MGAPAPSRGGWSFAIPRPVSTGQSRVFIDHGNSSRPPAGSGANPPSGHTLAPQPVKSGVRGRGWTRRTSVSSAARLPNAGRKIQDADCRLSGAFCRDRRRGEIQDPMIPVAGKATTGQASVVRLRIGSWRDQRSEITRLRPASFHLSSLPKQGRRAKTRGRRASPPPARAW